MDALGLALVFIGSFMLYEAVKNTQPTPVKTATTAITGTSTK